MNKIISISEALNEGLREEMEKDDKIFIMGEDIAAFGGRMKVTKGLLEKFGKLRVMDTPINEEIFISVAMGAAQVGLKPIVEFSHTTLAAISANDIFRAGLWKWICGNRFSLPIIIRINVSRGAGPEMSTSIISMFLNLMGIDIVAPSTPFQAKGILKSAIRGTKPIIILEDGIMYDKKGEVPAEDYVFPIGRGELRREGKDISIITYCGFSDLALSAADELAKNGISAEIIDLVSLKPLDTEKIIETARKTKKVLLMVDESPLYSALCDKIYFLIKEALPDVKIVFLGTKNLPVPFAHFGKIIFPKVEDIINSVKSILK